MPVNMDPKHRRRPDQQPDHTEEAEAQPSESQQVGDKSFGKETEEDREKELQDAEWKNLWDATEVIDMDKW